MRILLVNYEYPPAGGGAATAAAALAAELKRLGHTVVVLTGAIENLPVCVEEEGVVVHRVGPARRALDRSNLFEMSRMLLAALVRAPAIVRDDALDAAIIFFSLPGGPLGLVLRKFAHIPYVVSLRGGDVPGAEPSLGWIHRLLQPLRRRVLKSAIAVVANSGGLAAMAEEADHVPVEIIPNGVDAIYFTPGPRSDSERREPFNIVFAGRFREQKNVSFLLTRLHILGTDHVRLHLVGDGPDRESLERQARKLGIDQAIVWHGWLSREALRNLYQRSDCVVNASLYEGMSNVLLEAMACGLPVIASSIPGNRSLIEEGETGLLFELSEPHQFDEAIIRLQTDRVFASDLGRRARERVVAKYSWSSVAAAYVSLFERRSHAAHGSTA